MDEVLSMPCAACNLFPNSQSQEFVIFLMLYIPMLANLLQPKLRYSGDESSLLSRNFKRNIHVSCSKFKKRKGQTTQQMTKEISKFKVGDLVLLRNHKKQTPWYAKYMSIFLICKGILDGTYDLQDCSGYV